VSGIAFNSGDIIPQNCCNNIYNRMKALYPLG
jgi:hypothetical protein